MRQKLVVCHAPNNLANNPYLHAYGLKKYNVESILLMPTYINETTERIYYGYSSMGNPYNIQIAYHRNKLEMYKRLFNIACEGIDILHLYGGGKYWHPVYGKLAGTKVIRHFFGSDLRNLKPRRKLILGLISDNGVIVGEQSLMTNLTWRNATKNAVTMPIAVDPVFYQIAKTQSQERIIFFPTRHDEIKRTDIAFQAWKILRELDKTVKLVTLEWGDKAQAFKDMFRVDERVEWLPLLSRPAFMDMLRRSSLVWGQFGGAGHGATEIEAMAGGRPVFAHLEEQYRARYWNPPFEEVSDAKMLAEKTKALLDDDVARRAHSKTSFEWVKKTHDVYYVAGLLNQYYHKILNND